MIYYITSNFKSSSVIQNNSKQLISHMQGNLFMLKYDCRQFPANEQRQALRMQSVEPWPNEG